MHPIARQALARGRDAGTRYNPGMPDASLAPQSDRSAADARGVFLIGMMGAGKTSVGRLLAQRLGRRFVDADQEIEARCGVSIPVIFEIEGEAGFRQRERAMIDELTRLPGIVLATGGGAVLAPESRDRLRSRGRVVYLRASAEDIWQRTRRDRGRPLLATADPRGRIAELLAQREPLYAQTAHLVFDSSQDSLKSTVARLAEALEREPCGLPPAATTEAG